MLSNVLQIYQENPRKNNKKKTLCTRKILYFTFSQTFRLSFPYLNVTRTDCSTVWINPRNFWHERSAFPFAIFNFFLENFVLFAICCCNFFFITELQVGVRFQGFLFYSFFVVFASFEIQCCASIFKNNKYYTFYLKIVSSFNI